MIKRTIAGYAAALTLCGVGAVACASPSTPTVATPSTTAVSSTYKPLTDAQRYTGLLREYDVYFSSEEAADGVGKLMCKNIGLLGKNTTLEVWLNAAQERSDYPYTAENVQDMMSAAVAVYCPQYAG